MNVTHYDIAESPNTREHKTGVVILFLSAAVLLACTCKLILSQFLKNRLPVPFTVIVLILGFIIGTIIAHIDGKGNSFIHGEQQLKQINPHLIYYIFLPLLIFDSAFNNHFHVVRQQIVAAILLAGPGVLISMTTIALCGTYIFPYKWSWLESFMFGSILSATDPIAVVALLHDSGASKSLAALIDLESLLNDGSAFVIFMIFLDIVAGGSNSGKKIIVDIVKFTIGGPAFGLACGIIAVIILNLINHELEVEIISTFGVAYLIFYVAEVEIGVSAVLTLVVAGLFMAKHKYCISSRVQLPIASTWRIIVYFANILVFLITGVILAHVLISQRANIAGRDVGFSFVLYAVLHIGRVLSILSMHPFIRWHGVRLSWKEYSILTWSGLRGSMSVILGLIVDSDDRIDITTRDRFIFHICMMALLTLVINGTSTKFIISYFGLDKGTPESETILLQALEHMRTQTALQLKKMKHEEEFAEVDWYMLREYLPEKLVEEMDAARKTSVRQRLSVGAHSTPICQTSSIHPKATTVDIESIESPTMIVRNSFSAHSIDFRRNEPDEELVQPVFEFPSTAASKNQNIRNELTLRFLTALSVDYEKQWYFGMIRRRTLYILIESIEKAKNQQSFRLHWNLIVENFRLSVLLRQLMRFTYVELINEQFNKLLFDHVFLTIELTLAFHSARVRMGNIPLQFPELATIDEQVWNEVCQETHFYQQTAASILLDLKKSYQTCWRIQMTKRCAQMLLKYESTALTALYETGILGDTEYSHISTLIEKKLFDLEFYRVRMPNGRPKTIEDPFEILELFRTLPQDEKMRWHAVMKAKHHWFQPGQIILERGQTIYNAYLIIRGIVECRAEKASIYYRCDDIIGLEALYSHGMKAYGNYAVGDALLEVYVIDSELLNNLLAERNLAPPIYRKLAQNILASNYQSRLQLNRSQIKFLLEKWAQFYHQQVTECIQLKPNTRLLLLSGSIIHQVNDQHRLYDSMGFHILEWSGQIHINPTTVAFTWTHDDEMRCANEKSVKLNFPVRIFGSVCTDLLYPGYPSGRAESARRQDLTQEALVVRNHPIAQELPAEGEAIL